MAQIRADDLVAEVRGLHPRFSREGAPPIVVRQILARQLNLLRNKFLELDPDFVAVPGTISKELMDEALDSPTNLDNAVRVESFAQIIDNMRIQRNDVVFDKVWIVPLQTQYPGPYETELGRPELVFPAVALREGRMLLTDARRMGAPFHGWEEYVGGMSYHYVPSDDPVIVGKTTNHMFTVPTTMRDAVILDTAYYVALRLDMFQFAAALKQQFIDAVFNLNNQLASVAAGSSSQVSQSG